MRLTAPRENVLLFVWLTTYSDVKEARLLQSRLDLLCIVYRRYDSPYTHSICNKTKTDNNKLSFNPKTVDKLQCNVMY